jgi:DNA (cytosine-5)-methyltransferase 1
MPKPPKILATAVDLFCGAGGLTRGLLDAGLRVAAGYDIDTMCRFAYEYNNPGVKFHEKCISALTGRNLVRHYPRGHARVLVGCAPCQTFSKYTQGLKNRGDPKWTLLWDFGRLVRESKPDIVSMENVPELQRHKIFYDFLSVLADEGFQFGPQEVDGLLSRLWHSPTSSPTGRSCITPGTNRTYPTDASI